MLSGPAEARGMRSVATSRLALAAAPATLYRAHRQPLGSDWRPLWGQQYSGHGKPRHGHSGSRGLGECGDGWRTGLGVSQGSYTRQLSSVCVALTPGRTARKSLKIKKPLGHKGFFNFGGEGGI